MTATAIAMPTTIERPKHSALSWAVQDAMTVTWRNLVAMKRTPQVLVFSTIQPIIFVLMFRYVFGGAIRIPGVDHYVDYLMPGVFAQTVVFGSIQTGVGLAEDLHKGLIERFQSLPMARSAVLAGRTLADLVRNVFVVLLMVIVGFIVGWRIHTSVFGFIARRRDDVAVRARAVVGVRARRVEGRQRGGRAGGVVPDPRPVGVRVDGVRVGGLDAGSAAVVREPPAGVDRDRRGAGAHLRRAVRVDGQGARCDRLEYRDRRGRRTSRRLRLPPQGLTPAETPGKTHQQLSELLALGTEKSDNCWWSYQPWG